MYQKALKRGTTYIGEEATKSIADYTFERCGSIRHPQRTCTHDTSTHHQCSRSVVKRATNKTASFRQTCSITNASPMKGGSKNLIVHAARGGCSCCECKNSERLVTTTTGNDQTNDTSEMKNTCVQLLEAARDGRLGSVKFYLDNGFNLESEGDYGNTPLGYASQNGHLDIARLLLEKGASTEHESRYGETPLSLACKKGHLEVARLLLEKGANIEHQSIARTPLFLACHNGHLEIVRFLLEKGAKIDHQDNNGATPLCLAIICGRLETVRLLLAKGAGIEHQTINGETPLCLASEYRQVEVVRLLLEKGAKVDHQDKDGHTPLCLAIKHGESVVLSLLLENTRCSLAVTRLLLENGANIEHQNKNGDTPLCLASKIQIHAINGGLGDREIIHTIIPQIKEVHLELVRLLLEKGSNIEHQNQQGKTPLCIAISNGKCEIIRCLLEKGANIEHQNKDGRTPLCYAWTLQDVRLLLEKGAHIEHQDTEGKTPLCLACARDKVQVELIRLLLEKGADIEHQDKEGKTPLCLACERRRGKVELVKLLLDKGANIEHQDKEGCTPLCLASQKWNKGVPGLLREKVATIGVVRLLLEEGANIEHQDKHGYTPLCFAISKGHLEIVTLLLEKGANIEHQNKNGATPLYLASKCQFQDSWSVVRFLLDHGARIDYHLSELGNVSGGTPLHVVLQRAIQQPDHEIVYMLVQAAAQQGYAGLVQSLLTALELSIYYKAVVCGSLSVTPPKEISCINANKKKQAFAPFCVQKPKGKTKVD